MLASEVINAYEAFCPQEFSMEGDSVACKLALWTRISTGLWLLWIFVKKRWLKPLKRVWT